MCELEKLSDALLLLKLLNRRVWWGFPMMNLRLYVHISGVLQTKAREHIHLKFDEH